VVATALAVKKFDALLEIDVFIYSAGLLLEFVALVVLRYKQPALERGYRIPGGKPVVWLVAIVPALLIAAAFAGKLKGDLSPLWITIAALATGPLIYAASLIPRRQRAEN